LQTSAAKYPHAAPHGSPGFLSELNAEIDRLSDLRERTSPLSNVKRFGSKGNNNFWLIHLQDFVQLWTHRELGHVRDLRPSDIARLVTAGYASLGRRHDTDPRVISASIESFRSNDANKELRTLSLQAALCRCLAIKDLPYLLGIEI
jgi:hypothetical protein